MPLLSFYYLQPSNNFVILSCSKNIIQGRVIPAYSRLDLAPGGILRVLVSRVGNRYELRIAEGSEGKADQLLAL